MDQVTPTPIEARAALAEAGSHAAAMRRTDGQLVRILLALASTYLLVAVVMGLFPHGGSVFAGLALAVIVVGGLTAMLVMFWRIRAYSRNGILRFSLAAAAFTWWNAVVVGVSSWSGWWSQHQPATHFSVSALVAVVPLIVAAWLIGRR
ncbi:MAG: hypothetical protein ABI334_02610 [Candidatus Dormiibacterota bacterium]